VLRERRTLKPYSFPKDMTTMTICSLSKKVSGEAVSIMVEGRRLEVVECVGFGFDFLPTECEKREIVVEWEAQPIRELGKVLIHQPSTIKLWIDRQAASSDLTTRTRHGVKSAQTSLDPIPKHLPPMSTTHDSAPTSSSPSAAPTPATAATYPIPTPATKGLLNLPTPS
jgi:hypothetical protein